MEESNVCFFSIVVAIVLIACILCVVYIHNKKAQSREGFESFLRALSQSFHNAKWIYIDLHGATKRTPEEVSELINTRLEQDLKNDFITMLYDVRYFPKRCFRFFVDDPSTNNFMVKLFPTIKLLYDKYKRNGASAEDVKSQFFVITKEIILSELKKDRLLDIKKD